MIKLPIALSISFCESLDFDIVQGRVSMQGLFSSLFLNRFPSDPVAMSFFSYLCDGHGEGELKVEVHRLFADRSPQFVWRQRRWVKFPSDPLLPVATHFEAKRRLIFPEAADYLVQLMFDGKEIAQRVLFVRHE